MSFLHPTLLAVGLSSVAIPLIIHFFLRKKRRPVQWAAMRFLLEAARKHQRRRKLEQILLLALRCLLIALIAIGVARPLFGERGDSASTTLAVVIDNSIAASLTDSTGSAALERHRERADGLIGRLRPSRGDRVAIIPAASPVSPLVAEPTLDLDAARRALERLEPTSSRADLARAIADAEAILAAREGATRLVVLTDWRAGVLSTEFIESADPGNGAPAGLDLRLAPPAEDTPPNLRIVAVEPGRDALLPADTPAASQVLVTIERDGEPLPDHTAGLLVEALDAEGEPEAAEQRDVALPSGERRTTVAVDMPTPSAENTDAPLRARFVGDPTHDRLDADSTALRTVRLRESVRVGLVHARRAGRPLGEFDAADWLRVALKPEPATPIEIREISAPGLQSADLAGLDAAIVSRPDLVPDAAWADLARFHQRGGTLVFIPPAETPVHEWPDRLAGAVGFGGAVSREPTVLDTPEPLEAGGGAAALTMLASELDALTRGVSADRLLEVDAEPSAVVLATERGQPVLLRPAERAWLFATALDQNWTDLPAKPLFLPLIQEVVRGSAAPSRPLTVVAGEPTRLATGTIELVETTTGRRRPVESAGVRAPPTAGVWSARNARGETLGLLSVTPSPTGGATAPTPRDAVLAWGGRVAPQAEPTWLEAADAAAPRIRSAEPDDARDWIPFLIAAVLAVAELAVARFASHAARPTAGATAREGEA